MFHLFCRSRWYGWQWQGSSWRYRWRRPVFHVPVVTAVLNGDFLFLRDGLWFVFLVVGLQSVHVGC